MPFPKIVLNDVPVRILCINGSPRGRSNSQWLIDKAMEGALSLGKVEIETFNIRAKKLAPCMGCVEYCQEHKKCIHEDDFEKLTELWLRADGIIWAAPVYTFSPPSQVRSWMDRFFEIVFQNCQGNGKPFHRFLKPTGVIIQGSSRFGGQELTAQSMLEHVVMMGCIPVSGDMPHSDQAILGQVIDKTTPEHETGLLNDSFRMGVRVAEMTKLIKLSKLALASSLPDDYWYSQTVVGEVERPTAASLNADEARYLDLMEMNDIPISIFTINGSPRAPKISSSQILLDAAKAGAQTLTNVDFTEYSFYRQDIDPCRMCIVYCSKHEECVILDDFQEFREKWLGSDGALWGVPTYHLGPPSIVRAALDRMNELRFQTSRKHQQTQYPRLNKPVGVMVHGSSHFGGQEITQQFFLHHAMLLQCLPVTSDLPETYYGVGAKVSSRESLLRDEETLNQCHIQGLRVAEMTKLIKAGLILTQDSLGNEYFPSKEKMGLIERRPIIA
jgi:multimeric flavodoxin WrbA